MPAVAGDDYTYQPSHGNGFGENALGQALSAEMQELDLLPGTPVTVLELDAQSSWPLVEWVDGKGLPRITTVEPNEFDSDFAPVGG
jgi:hypothetical protein